MQYSKDEELPTVMPRILDPTLQFDEQSILKGLQTSKDKYSSDKKCFLNESVIINIPEDPVEKTSVVTVLVKYKYHMLAVLVAIVLIFLAYKLYKYYFTKKTEEVVPEPGPAPVVVDMNDSKISYLNNFISDDSEEEDEPEPAPPVKTKERIVVTKMREPEPEPESEPEPETEPEFDSQVTEMPYSQVSITSESGSESQSQSQSQSEEEIDKFLLEDAIDVFNKYK